MECLWATCDSTPPSFSSPYASPREEEEEAAGDEVIVGVRGEGEEEEREGEVVSVLMLARDMTGLSSLAGRECESGEAKWPTGRPAMDTAMLTGEGEEVEEAGPLFWVRPLAALLRSARA